MLLTQATRRLGVSGGNRLDDRGVVDDGPIEELVGERVVAETGVDAGVDVDGDAHELGVVSGPGDREVEPGVGRAGGRRLGAFGVGIREIAQRRGRG